MSEVVINRVHMSDSADASRLCQVVEEAKCILSRVSAFFEQMIAIEELPDLAGGDLDNEWIPVAKELHILIGVMQMVHEPMAAKYLQSIKTTFEGSCIQGGIHDKSGLSVLRKAIDTLLCYLEGRVRGDAINTVVLYPSYRDVLLLQGQTFVHPADLWQCSALQGAMDPHSGAVPLRPDVGVQHLLERLVLSLLKGDDLVSAQKMASLFSGLAKGERHKEWRGFWMVAAGYCDAIAAGLIELDIFAKRTLSGVLRTYIDLVRCQTMFPSSTLTQMLFFCAQAQPDRSHKVPSLLKVRSAYGLHNFVPVGLSGYFREASISDQRAAMLLAIKRAKSAWADSVGGQTVDTSELSYSSAQLAQALQPLVPEHSGLIQRLDQIVQAVLLDPKKMPQVSMEVASVLLYLEASAHSPVEVDVYWAHRLPVLANWLKALVDGSALGAAPSWIHSLSRGATEADPVIEVAKELKKSIAEVERQLEVFFRGDWQRDGLASPLRYLEQMRGVLALLSHGPALRAVNHVHSQLTQLSIQTNPEAVSRGMLSNVITNVGGLSILIDALFHQSGSAVESGYVFDESRKVLTRHTDTLTEPSSAIKFIPLSPLAASHSNPQQQASAQAALKIPLGVRKPEPRPPLIHDEGRTSDQDLEIIGVFKHEALALLVESELLLSAIAGHEKNDTALTELRRIFHTLKGSANMVNQRSLGEMAWQVEQTLDPHLLQGLKPCTEILGNVRAAWVDIKRVVDALPSDDNGLLKTDTYLKPVEIDVILGAQDTLQLSIPPKRFIGNPLQQLQSHVAVNDGGGNSCTDDCMFARASALAHIELRDARRLLLEIFSNLERLNAQLRDMQLHANGQMSVVHGSRAELRAGTFSPEADVHQHVHFIAENMAVSIHDMATVHRQLQRSLDRAYEQFQKMT